MCKACDENNPNLKPKREAMEEAIEAYLREKHGGPDRILMDWMLVFADHSIDPEDGGSVTGMGVEVNESAALYRQVGLADYALTTTKARYFHPDN